LVVPKSQYLKSSFLQTPVAFSISPVIQVLATVNLDNQAPFQTDKVQYEIHVRMLAAKFTARQLPIA